MDLSVAQSIMSTGSKLSNRPVVQNIAQNLFSFPSFCLLKSKVLHAVFRDNRFMDKMGQ